MMAMPRTPPTALLLMTLVAVTGVLVAACSGDGAATAEPASAEAAADQPSADVSASDQAAPPRDPGAGVATPPALPAEPTAEPTTESSTDLRARAEALAARVARDDLTSCEAAAQLYESSPDDADIGSFIAHRSDVLAGLGPSLIAGSDGSEVQGFTDSGFRVAFRDGSNQVRHLAAAIQAGLSLGATAALLHRVLRPDTPQDAALNDAGARLGAALSSGAIGTSAAGDWIRTNVCE